MTPDGEYYRFLAKIIIQIVGAALKENPQKEFYLACQHDLGEFAQTSLAKKYPWSYVKKIVDLHVDNNQYCQCITYAQLQELFPCEVLSDSGALEEICKRILDSQPKAVADYKKGKLASLNHLKGLVMRETKGKADIAKVEAILKEKMT
jgi:Asp-tRNA(Asn)/Glu-tRNA(Gln) amidotransferase B subunit